ncbi:hypothetical protein [Lachnospira eligens]|jgi:hypothetical protein|uniref:hypothetical protein n=1 Tax=Lachnospira eligens TaxID=39485 RepID=UPI00189BAC7D|nr:hypothetical protein [Lachnospira eligens]
MKNYIGVKVVAAEPMSRGEYNEYRGWKIPSDENPEDEGYQLNAPPKMVYRSTMRRSRKFYIRQIRDSEYLIK